MLQHNADMSGADTSAVGSVSQGGVYTARSDVYPDGTPFSGGSPVYASADGLQGTIIVVVPACGGYPLPELNRNRMENWYR